MNSVHEAFMIIERLAALCATAGVTEETQKLANEHVQKLLDTVVRSSVTSLSAKNAGLLV